MAALVESIEIARSPDDVFAYATDPSRMAEWQESVVGSQLQGEGPPGPGKRVTQTRRIGKSERTMTAELTEFTPPSAWAGHGIDGPVRAQFRGTVEPLEEGARSRVTLELDFKGHGIGMLLVPLVVRKQAQRELPKNMQTLKERLESGA